MNLHSISHLTLLYSFIYNSLFIQISGIFFSQISILNNHFERNCEDNVAFSCKSKGPGCHAFQPQGILPTGSVAEFGIICCCDSIRCNGADLVFPTSPATTTVTTTASFLTQQVDPIEEGSMHVESCV